MKNRFLFCVGALALAAYGAAQTPQSDVTVPQVISITGGMQMEILEIYLERTTINAVTFSESTSFLPDDIELAPFGGTLLASVKPGSMAGGVRAAEEQKIVEGLNKSIVAINRDLAMIRRERVGLSVYNDLVKQHKTAMKESLAMAKYMQAKQISDPTQIATLTKVVNQLEAVGKYTITVNQVLTRV